MSKDIRKPRSIIGSIEFYGYWDDVGSYEFFVNRGYGQHESTCDVFFCGGSDYGGGVVSSYTVPYEELSKHIMSLPQDVREYDLYPSTEKWCKENGTKNDFC